MKRHLERELEKLNRKILLLGSMVEDRVREACKAIKYRDVQKAKKIISTDYEIDEFEVEIEEECLKILALHQPVANDLRFLSAVIKINNDLERIGDETVNIAQRVETIATDPDPQAYFNYSEMTEKTVSMLKMSLDALVNYDIDLAFRVCILDDEVDRIKDQASKTIREAIKKYSQQVDQLIDLLLISRHLERIADHATNIAEEVIYIIEGEIIRHGKAI